jgi:[glutamine synthetase] adenylyltransferase / [glutamine synthetase]-adenylyl-L-tyrosine phosphorylase
VATPEVLGRAMAAAPDPELARVALSRVGEHPVARELLGQHGAAEAAAPLLGFSTAAADFLFAHPEEAALFADPTPRSRDDLLAEAMEAATRHGVEAGLRRFRRRALYRVAVRDLAGEALEDVVAEVTWIAEVCLDVAVAEAGAGVAVLGMGKLGGAELNYASDVDLIFVHADAGPQAQAEASRRAARIVAMLSEPTEEGVALRVDPSLRPEGRAGPLSRSMAGTLGYYRRHAATWEKQAWLKARPVAGDLDLGARIVRELEPVIYPEELDPAAIDDVRAMKVRIEEYVRARGKEATELKTGRGGIRDIEFAVQLLQLVHGRRDPALREPNTLLALGALSENGYVAVNEAGSLAESYRFLRSLEHRLQLARDVQTHELPRDEPSLRRLARSLGFDGADELQAAHARHTSSVRGLHRALFYRPLLEAFAGTRAPRPGAERAATEELLGGLGFRDPPAAYRRFAHLVDPSSRLGRVLGHVFPMVAPALALAPDPDAALVRFERVAESIRNDDVMADRLASEPRMVDRLVRGVGWSSWLADAFATSPHEIGLLSAETDERRWTSRLGLVLTVAGYAGAGRTVPGLGRDLSAVADTAIREAVAEAGPGIPLAVIALGKLGGQELNVASDLDVVFVFDGEGPEAFEEARRAAEETLAGIRQRGFEADPDLRPEGRNGPLARSLVAYLEYWERWAQTWEFQALLKARAVAGDPGLGRRFELAAQDFAYPEVLPLDKVSEIRRMRVRMEEERVKPADARRFHFKLGYGGLADVQFAVELSLLRHGREHYSVRLRNTLEALEALAGERLIEDSVSLALGGAYVFLNEVKNAMEIDRRVPAEAIPTTPEGQVALARRLGYEEFPRATFLEEYRRVTRRARRAMERVFYPDQEA